MILDRIYVAVRGDMVKVGRSMNVSKRMKAHGTRLIWCSEPQLCSATIEHEACQAMRRHVVAGKREWFRIRPEVALRVVRRAIYRARYQLVNGEWEMREVAAAIGVSESLIYQRKRGEWAPFLGEGGGK